jgi:hypothetical protein
LGLRRRSGLIAGERRAILIFGPTSAAAQQSAGAAAQNLYKRAIRDPFGAGISAATDLDDIPVRPPC